MAKLKLNFGHSDQIVAVPQGILVLPASARFKVKFASLGGQSFRDTPHC